MHKEGRQIELVDIRRQRAVDIGGLPLQAALRRPTYLETSAWLEHIPFAFWIIDAFKPRVVVELGTHFGVSYFAFCQSVAESFSDTRCYAVDTWKGDEHAGQYGENVYEKVRGHNQRQYSSFSQLMRMTFDEAAPYFADGSIDVLHIDGLHTYEAVKHDFETWRPKLSERAVVLFHDTNVMERDFGVQRFFRELSHDLPSFEFLHGHGLGVVAVGDRPPEALGTLFDSSVESASGSLIRSAFSRLGEACAHRQARDHLQSAVQAVKGSAAQKEAQLQERLTTLGKISGDLEARRADIADQLETALSREKEILSLHAGAAGEVSRLKGLVRDAKAVAETQVASLSEKLSIIETAKARIADELAAAGKRESEASEKASRLERLIVNHEAEISRISASNDHLGARVTELAARNHDLLAEQARTEKEIIAIRQVRDQLAHLSEEGARRVSALEGRAQGLEARLASSLRHRDRLLAQNSRRTNEISSLTGFLVKAQQEIETHRRTEAARRVLEAELLEARQALARLKAAPLRHVIGRRFVTRSRKLTGRVTGQILRFRRVIRKRARMLKHRFVGETASTG